jgi:hypothetical protein
MTYDQEYLFTLCSSGHGDSVVVYLTDQAGEVAVQL